MAGQLWVCNLALFMWDKKPSYFIPGVMRINIIFGRLSLPSHSAAGIVVQFRVWFSAV